MYTFQRTPARTSFEEQTNSLGTICLVNTSVFVVSVQEGGADSRSKNARGQTALDSARKLFEEQNDNSMLSLN